MRTTIDIDEDILRVARERARREDSTMGQVISALARRGLTTPEKAQDVEDPQAIYGFRPLSKRGGVITNDIVDQLRDDDAY